MIRNSLDSLQKEKFEKRRKQEEFKKSAMEIVLEKEYRKRQEREMSRLPDGGAEELARAEKMIEQAKNENYKQVWN